MWFWLVVVLWVLFWLCFCRNCSWIGIFSFMSVLMVLCWKVWMVGIMLVLGIWCLLNLIIFWNCLMVVLRLSVWWVLLSSLRFCVSFGCIRLRLVVWVSCWILLILFCIWVLCGVMIILFICISVSRCWWRICCFMVCSILKILCRFGSGYCCWWKVVIWSRRWWLFGCCWVLMWILVWLFVSLLLVCSVVWIFSCIWSMKLVCCVRMMIRVGMLLWRILFWVLSWWLSCVLCLLVLVVLCWSCCSCWVFWSWRIMLVFWWVVSFWCFSCWLLLGVMGWRYMVWLRLVCCWCWCCIWMCVSWMVSWWCCLGFLCCIVLSFLSMGCGLICICWWIIIMWLVCLMWVLRIWIWWSIWWVRCVWMMMIVRLNWLSIFLVLSVRIGYWLLLGSGCRLLSVIWRRVWFCSLVLRLWLIRIIFLWFCWVCFWVFWFCCWLCWSCLGRCFLSRWWLGGKCGWSRLCCCMGESLMIVWCWLMKCVVRLVKFWSCFIWMCWWICCRWWCWFCWLMYWLRRSVMLMKNFRYCKVCGVCYWVFLLEWFLLGVGWMWWFVVVFVDVDIGC